MRTRSEHTQRILLWLQAALMACALILSAVALRKLLGTL